MKKNSFLNATRAIFSRNKKKAYKQTIDSWFQANGDETLRLQYKELNSDSTVFDLGGYKGQWTSDIFARYCCNIYCFEPVRKFATAIEERFSQNPRIHVFPFGLAEQTKETIISDSADGSSMFTGNGQENIQLVQASSFLKENNVKRIDLIKINIEGGEYDLLDHLIESGTITMINNLQIQFHNLFPEAEQRMRAIQANLSRTHRITWQYEFVWENWEKITRNTTRRIT
ncbi:MAG: FkbM family methyltransferase [Desulfurivibrionaceae bacterium]|jgi:FkbM family methyltransferase